ncbi:FAD-dependent oxidoreductase [Peptococcaceae bacterium 1198_IL3148]
MTSSKLWKRWWLAMVMVVFCFAVTLNDTQGADAAETEDSYDLIVVGSDPEGIAAAISGARNGLDTLLVDTRPTVGGLMTRGWLNTIDMNYKYNPYGPKHDHLNKGIFTEFYNQIEGDSFDVTTAQNVFNSMLEQHDNIDFELGAKQITPVVTGEKGNTVVTGVKVRKASGQTVTYSGERIIDATQDADLAAAAGVPYSLAHEDYGFPDQNMAVTLVFRLEGLTDEDWETIKRTLNTDPDPNTGANNVSAWGFGIEMEGYQSTNPRVGMRGLNIGRQNDNSILINALHVYNVNPLSAASKAEAIELARQELPHIVEYLNENIPGLENAFLAGVASELYIRESRHIYGEYRLTVDDVLENRDFDDRIGFGSYPVDVQATGEGTKGYVLGKPTQYAIPFRCIVPLKVDNLLVVGRSASFDSLAHGSARVIPTGMATGQAAGAAAAISIDEDITFREMSKDPELIKELQDTLNRQGMELEPFDFSSKVKEKNHWSYEGLKLVRKHGLARGEYTNNYYLDSPITLGEFTNILDKMTTIYQADVPDDLDLDYDREDQAKRLTEDDVEDIFDEYGYSLKILRDAKLQDNIEDHDGIITYGAAYMVIYHLFEDLELL